MEDITKALWGTKVSPGTISNLNNKAYKHIETWRSFFVWLKEGGLTGVRLIIGDKNFDMLETIPEVYFLLHPRNKMKTVALMLKAIHAFQ